MHFLINAVIIHFIERILYSLHSFIPLTLLLWNEYIIQEFSIRFSTYLIKYVYLIFDNFI